MVDSLLGGWTVALVVLSLPAILVALGCLLACRRRACVRATRRPPRPPPSAPTTSCACWRRWHMASSPGQRPGQGPGPDLDLDLDSGPRCGPGSRRAAPARRPTPSRAPPQGSRAGACLRGGQVRGAGARLRAAAPRGRRSRRCCLGQVACAWR